MKLTLLFAVVLSAIPLPGLRAQTPQATPPPLPKGPIPVRAPATSQWLVSITSGTDDPVKVPDASTRYATRTLVRKVGTMRDEITMDAAGGRTERWCEGDIESTLAPGATDPTVNMFSPVTPNNPNFTNYSKTDFPAFSWVSKHNYVGAEMMEGVPCYFFQDGVTDMSGASANGAAPTTLPSTGRTAFISMQTLLPVLVDNNGVVTLIQMEQPTSSQITVPKNVQDAIDNMRREVTPASGSQ